MFGVVASVSPLVALPPTDSIKPASTETIQVVAVGDVMLGRSVNSTMHSRGDWTFPFLATAEYLKSADVTFGNLESPFGQSCPITNEGMVFCADTRSVEGLVYSGFDVLSVANNHSHNQGLQGLELSLNHLASNGIQGLVEGKAWRQDVKGIKLSWVAYDDTIGPIDLDEVSSLIRVEAEVSDHVLVSVHWGNEYRDQPSPRQQYLARAMIDSGASVIIGHHPHWVQPVEEYSHGLIFYSLGNFVFDQMWSEQTRRGMVAELVLSKDAVVSYQGRLVTIYDYAQPRFE